MNDREPDKVHEWLLYDLAAIKAWKEADGEDNAEFRKRLMSNLKYALTHELTEIQQAYVTAYYAEKKTIPEIAKEFGISCSTVSRTLGCARRNLMHVLQYTSPHLLGMDIPVRNKPAVKKYRRKRRGRKTE